ncbi:MAG: bifunctional diaminohydroxyphosphoribosylaminopyrimidine deaminase/5-amino-6-(5-phosphoribosylamino)uracil reductase RibD [Pseudomonadota bacterium]
MQSDRAWMAAAAQLAGRARPLAHPNPGVGALLVSSPETGSRVLGRGWTQPGGRPHAEAHAFELLAPGQAVGSTLYVTLEPCAHKSKRGPPCCDLVAAEQPARVVIGQHDPDPRTAGQGIARLQAAGIEIDVLEDQASARSLAGYLTQARDARPYVTLKLATSLDGCIALADGTSQWLTGEPARAHVHAKRAWHDAILVGGATWRYDEPRLDVRLAGLEQRSPQRFVLTSGAVPEGAEAIKSPEEIGTLTDIQYLYVEGGAQTAASFLERDLVDELHLYRAPLLIGDGQRSLAGLGLSDLSSAHGRWQLIERRMLGSDEFTSYQRLRD